MHVKHSWRTTAPATRLKYSALPWRRENMVPRVWFHSCHSYRLLASEMGRQAKATPSSRQLFWRDS